MKRISIGKNVTIEQNVEIGVGSSKENTKIIIGDNCILRSGTKIYYGVTLGNGVQTGHNAILRGENIIGNNVSIGSFTEIGLRNVIGDNTRIHSGCFLEDVTIGKYVFIGPKVVFTNDPHPYVGNKGHLQGAVVGDYAIVCASSIILPFIRIGKKSLIGAGSVVTRDVAPGIVVFGNPAKEMHMLKDVYCDTQKGHRPYEKYPKKAT